ncbi:MAG: antirestriction protein ArdA [Treponema sp.]|nr:antirestriction protein ArdA [Treponema sp.]
MADHTAGNAENFSASIMDIRADIPGFAERLDEIIAQGAPHGSQAELDYLAERIEGLGVGSREIFAANVEAGRNCGSVAEMINLTFDENLSRFHIQPAFNAEIYGEFLVGTAVQDTHADALSSLGASDDPAYRELAEYFERMAVFVDYEAYGMDAALKENGVFTEQGYLTGGDGGLLEIYRGPDDIPPKHAVGRARPEEKPSVMARIAEHRETQRKEPKEPREAKQRDSPNVSKRKPEPEL